MYSFVQSTVWAYISLGVYDYNPPSSKAPKVPGFGLFRVETKEGNLWHLWNWPYLRSASHYHRCLTSTECLNGKKNQYNDFFCIKKIFVQNALKPKISIALLWWPNKTYGKKFLMATPSMKKHPFLFCLKSFYSEALIWNSNIVMCFIKSLNSKSF